MKRRGCEKTFCGRTTLHNKHMVMKTDMPVLGFIKTDFTKIDPATDIETVRLIFNYSSKRFLPVVDDTKLIGVILREDFLRKFVAADDYELTAKDLVSKEMIKLSPENTIEEAMEVFSTNIFHVVPIATDDNHLIGMLHIEDVGQIFLQALSLENTSSIAEANSEII